MSNCKDCKDQEVAEALLMAVRLGIDHAVYTRQGEWRGRFLGLPNLYALKIELEKSIEQSVSLAMRRLLETKEQGR